MSERYYHAATEKSILQLTTSKEGLIVSLTIRSLGNGEWATMILNEKQTEGLKKFFCRVKPMSVGILIIHPALKAVRQAGWFYWLGYWWHFDLDAIMHLERPWYWQGTARDLCLMQGIAFVEAA